MPKSRSTLDTNVEIYRNELFFTADNVKGAYPDYDPEKGLDQYALKDPARDAAWIFRRERTDGDETRILSISRAAAALMAQHAAPESTPDEGEEAAVPDPSALLRQMVEGGTSRQYAELQALSVRAYGPYFVVAKTWGLNAEGKPTITKPWMVEDSTGSRDPVEAETLHPLAGLPMPLDVFWLPLLDTSVIDGATRLLMDLNTRRSPVEEAAFPATLPAVDDAGRHDDGGGEAGTGEGADETPAPPVGRGRKRSA